MKKIMLYLLLGMLSLVYACEQDPEFNFRGEERIYFVYPQELDWLGRETGRELDSMTYSFVQFPAEIEQDTVWVKVKRVGERSKEDKNYMVTVVADSCTAVEGKDFEPLQPSYVFRKNLGVDSLPLIVYRKYLKTVLNKNILLRLGETSDFKVGFVEYETIKISISDFLPEPEGWYLISGFLGDYHYMKYEKWIELTGSMEMGNSASYRSYYASLVKNYFNSNTIIDPLSGERVTCNL